MHLVVIIGTLAQDAQAEVDLGERQNGERAVAHKKRRPTSRQPPLIVLFGV
jgi:hypothetical protein